MSAKAIFERGFLRASFVLWKRIVFVFCRARARLRLGLASARPPNWNTLPEVLAIVAAPRFSFIPGLSGSKEKRGAWRQEHTSLQLEPATPKTGHKAAPLVQRRRYGFRFQWANSYAELREILYKEGLFDVRVVPGMTVRGPDGPFRAAHASAR